MTISGFGRMVRDPSTKEVSGHQLTEFTVAWDTLIKGKSEANFMDCKSWGKTGETIARFFPKGKPIYVVGKLRVEKWKDKDGNPRSKPVMDVREWQFCPSDNTAKKSDGGGVEDIPF